ncbi:hypothetical protein LC087_18330 [Bacillus carboniphilus]|uniref:Phr family secreted Rap phosphatase inhibitor n=1 Tax=Bacillus carboniphilus TaxID=86663 RepID=A0ABY9JTA1_9BACI|nr:hypothetical protein [Bacillus carboniphilus]WLR42609.1 hypothetical protein LC087_18330 [Bacillus carboniphilus]
MKKIIVAIFALSIFTTGIVLFSDYDVEAKNIEKQGTYDPES